MKRVIMMVLVLASVLLGVVGSVSAAHGGGIDPFSVRLSSTSTRLK